MTGNQDYISVKKNVALFLRTEKFNGDKLMGITMIRNFKKWKEPDSPDSFLIGKALRKRFEGVGTQAKKRGRVQSEWESQLGDPELGD